MKTGDIISQISNLGIGTMFALKNKEQEERLQKYLADLTSKQQLDIYNKAQAAQTNSKKNEIAFQLLALERNNINVGVTKNQKQTTLMLIGFLFLSLVSIGYLKRKQHG